jgi:CelD/BcsL family acetyltransferase involved in cellulose biosynthesis
MVQIEQITTDVEIDRLAPQWKALWRRIPDATPFQSPEWLLSWWRCFGTGRPLILVARKGTELIGVLPLYFLNEGVSCKLLPIGISLSDYLDALVDRSIRGTIDAMLAAIAEIPGWDECYLPSMSPDAALLTGAPPPGLVESRYPDESCTLLRLPSSESFDEVLPRKMRQNLRRAERKTALVGASQFEIADEPRIVTAMRDLFRLHEMRWRRCGEPGVCAEPTIRDFHMRAACRLFEGDMLRLYTLRLDGVAVAVCYCFKANGVTYAYLSGFDPDHAELSPGTQLLAYAIKSAVREGAREFHFLRGSETYKAAWRPIARPGIVRALRHQC